MNKLIFSLYLLICLWIFGGIAAIAKLTINIYNIVFIYNIQNSLVISVVMLLTKIIVVGIVSVYLFNFSKTINKLTLDNFLSKSNGKSFGRVGKVLLCYSFFKLLFNIIEISLGETYQKLVDFKSKESIDGAVILLTTSLFLLIISKIIEKGYYFKNENDLTI